MKTTGFLGSLTLCLLFISSLSGKVDGTIQNKMKPVDSTVIPADSLFFCRQLAFVDGDNIFFYLNQYASRLSDRSCAVFYRQARINKYYQLDGPATDHYVANDALAATLQYKAGQLDGPCVFYYKNGHIREDGAYIKNEKKGIWVYYYENGQKAKTINFTDSGTFLLEYFTENGHALVRNGNGHFKGKVLFGTATSPQECDMEGDVKDGLQEGEWKMYNKYLSGPANIEIFFNGRFEKGRSYSLTGTRDYYEEYFCRFENLPLYKGLDQYTQDDFCEAYGKRMRGSPFTRSEHILAEIDQGIKNILKRRNYSDYSGWIFADMKFDKDGKIGKTCVRLFEKNDAFEKDIYSLLDHLEKEEPIRLNDVKIKYEKICVILVESNEVVIPEALLMKQRVHLTRKETDSGDSNVH
ncbi:toxin-antitoxin system YwqK family antitoxin [Puia dinghuensis]|uniref:Toxin-antitoxin system YwqK family antitoxin n=1 Tax=Puia dinghuensis TaxID=1792502 RepID=A0A8J2UGQ8_9BACT|nr:hypothetical protein [Puia dinghuensis]GGB15545.1 hypothetical protein GCM10011511_44200 [Puia dinghuensis]